MLFPGVARCAEDPPLVFGAPLNEQVLRIPGDGRHPVMLEVTLYMPDGPGPFPLAVMNHGADGKKPPKLHKRYRTTSSANYFLSRGYAVALPMMRGFAGSGGKVVPNGCDLENIGLDNARDIYAVIDRLSILPKIDGSRVVVAGQSFGGWNTLALGALQHPRVKGLIVFAGGLKPSDCPLPESSLARGAARFGARTRIPSLWFYGDNDKVFSPPAWHAMYDGYRAAGGRAELVAYGKFMQDSHNLLGFPEGLAIWVPRVDAFLARLGLPATLLHPEYLPAPFPAATGYAAIDDVYAVPWLSDRGRELYRRFLTEPKPRAFVLSPGGAASSSSGGFDPLGHALNSCRKQSKNCRPYAVDDQVVWVRPTPAPAATRFAGVADPSAVPYLNEKGRQGYRKFLSLKKPRAFAISPDGGWGASSRGGDPLVAALRACGKAHAGCRLYAVDEEVVWPE